MNPIKKKLLLVSRRAPYGNNLPQAALELTLAASAFEQAVSLLFMDDGVWQLRCHQEAVGLGRKSIEKTLDSLPLYDLETLYVDAASLQSRGLSAAQLRPGLQLLDETGLRDFIESHEQVFSF